MKPLAEMFEGIGSQKGFSFEMLKREGDVALYKKTSEGKVFYEAIVVKKNPERTVKMGGVDVFFEAKESYPSDEQFGINGFTFWSRDMAEIGFSELKNRVESRINKGAQ